MAISAKVSGTQEFWNYFWTGYIEMTFISLGDFFFLDCYLRAKVKDKEMIKGAEKSKAWEAKEWMKLAIPEHFLFWPIIICPVVGLLVAGISNIFYQDKDMKKFFCTL